MGLLDIFKKMTGKEKEFNRVNDLLNRLIKGPNPPLIEPELQRMNYSSLSEKEKEKWHEVYAVEAFRRHDRAEALKRFQEGYKLFPDSSGIIFGLGQEYSVIGDVEKMIAMFDKLDFPGVSGNHIIKASTCCYLWDRHDKSIEYLMRLLKHYYDYGFADPTFLYLRKLPAYDDLWANLGVAFELTNNLDEFMKITCESKLRLREYHFDRFITFLECVQNDNYEKVIKQSHEYRENCNRKKISDTYEDYNSVRLAVLEARSANSHLEAERILDQVQIVSKDRGWYDGVLLLAKCGLANKFGDLQKENVLRAEWLSEPRALLNPDTLFHFRLIHYQELIKKEYLKRITTR